MRKISAFTLFLVWASGAAAQAPQAPRLSHILPVGGQKGSTFELTVTGQFVDKAQTLHFSFPGAKAEPVGMVEVEDPKTPPKKGKGMRGPQTSQRFKVTLPADAPLGIHDLRLVTEGGISNPRAFVVSAHKESVEKEPNDDVPQATKVSINSSVSGVISAPTDVDYFLFSGKKGQRVIINCLTTSVDSRLPVQIQLFSAGGSYLGSGRGYWNNDALLDATLPADDDYYVRVCSFTYTVGGPDYFYHLTISTAPWIDSVEPLAVEPGKETKVTVWGRNLPGGTPVPGVSIDGRPIEKAEILVKAPPEGRATQRLSYSGTILPPSAMLSGMELRVKNESGSSNPFLLAFATAPVVLDNGANDTPETAQKISPPCEISGRIEKKGDKDWYAFNAKKGEPISIEVIGERLGAPDDLFFQVRDDKGKLITEQDENAESTSLLFFTRSDDPPRYRFNPPADGVYHVMITSREAFSVFGPRHVYVARIGAERPNFHLVAMPAHNTPEGVTLRQGGHQAFTVYAFRDGGFTGDITITGEKLPAGLSMAPQKLSFGQKAGAFVLSAAPEAPPSVGAIKVIGTASIGGKKVEREVRIASITWPSPVGVAGAAAVSRLDREIAVAIRGQASYAIAADKKSLSAPSGTKVTIPVTFTAIRPDFKTPVNVLVINPPPGLVSQPAVLSADKKTGTVSLDAKGTAAPGVYTLVLQGQTAPLGKAPAPKGPLPPNVVEVAPPITLTIVPKQLAKLSVDGKAVKLAPGKSAELVVRVNREFDYPGAFKLEVVNTKDQVSADATTIKEGEDEGRIHLSAARDARTGTTIQVTIRATALFNDVAVVHELKNVQVTIVK